MGPDSVKPLEHSMQLQTGQSIKFINHPTLSLFLGLELGPPSILSSAVLPVGVFLGQS